MEEIVTMLRNSTIGGCEDMPDGWCQRHESCRDCYKEQLDAIEKELDDYVELPKDANEASVRPDDKLDGYGKTIEVVELRYGRSGWVLISRDGNAYADTYAFSHVKPDTWERIIADAMGNRTQDPAELVERCKALAGGRA